MNKRKFPIIVLPCLIFINNFIISLQGGLADWEHREELILQFKLKGICWLNSCLLEGGESFAQFRHSPHKVSPTYTIASNLIYSVLIKYSSSPETSRTMLNQISRYLGPGKFLQI